MGIALKSCEDWEQGREDLSDSGEDEEADGGDEKNGNGEETSRRPWIPDCLKCGRTSFVLSGRTRRVRRILTITSNRNARLDEEKAQCPLNHFGGLQAGGRFGGHHG
jgi:hypothetical protein